MKFGNKKVEFDIIPRLTKKAAQSPCNFFIAAAAFTKKGNLLGVVSNNHNNFFATKRGQGKHAEAQLVKRFGSKIDTIYLIRIGRDMSRLPIHPCETCQKMVNKMGIRVIPIHIDFGYKPTEIYP